MQFSTAFIAAAASFLGSPAVSAAALPQAPGNLPSVAPITNVGIRINSDNKDLDGKFLTALHAGAGQNLAVVGGTTADHKFTFKTWTFDQATKEAIGSLTYTIQTDNGPADLPGSFVAAKSAQAGGIPVMFGAGNDGGWRIGHHATSEIILHNGKSKWVVCDASTMTNAPGMAGQKVLGWEQEKGSKQDTSCSAVTLTRV